MSLAMLFASRCEDIADDLPPALTEGLAEGPYGRPYLCGVDAQLLTGFPAQSPL